MIVNDIARKVKESVCEEIDLVKEKENLYRIETPFRFDDGDSYVVFLEVKVDGYLISDKGHTLMHISYWTDVGKFFEGRRGKTFDAIIERFGLELDDGDIRLRTDLNEIGKSVYRFIQALDKISDMEYLDREQIRTLFVEDVVEFTIANLDSYRPQKDWHYKEHDPEGNYKAHVALMAKDKTILVFALANDDTTRDATISLHFFAKSGLDFTSIGIFREQESINRKVLARFTDVCERQLSNFSRDNQIRFMNIVQKELK